MSHWFHRNPIKASLEIDFSRRSFPSSGDANLICSMLRQTRSDLLKLYSDPSNTVENVETLFKQYMSLITGFVNDLSGRNSGGDSKLRYSFKSKWTQSLNPQNQYEVQDAVYEMLSVITNNALWLSKHAAYVAATVVEPSEKEAKEVHKCLKQSAGQFKYVQDNLINKLIKTDSNQPQAYADVNDLILSTYINQCKAEAQEITIARAIELKHSPSLICSIAQSTSILFQSASDSLSSLDKNIAEKWSKYFALKSRFYKSQAYCYFGQDLLAQDKCGDAIKCLQESQKFYDETKSLCQIYANLKGAGTQAVPERHQFFKNLGTIITRVAEKCDRENGMIYHQKLPIETPILDTKAIHGLAEPEEFIPPEPHALWSPNTYDSFNIAKALEVKDKSKQTSENVAPPKEAPIPQGDAQPNNNSGCLIS